jgi:hypothetical protein
VISCPSEERLLAPPFFLGRALGRREGFEAFVGDRLAAPLSTERP